MQIVIQVICTKGTSLREKIVKDSKLQTHLLQVSEEKRNDRSRGWAKLHSTEPDRRGAINVQWLADTNILFARVVSRNGNKPNLIVGDFVDYLIARHKTRIQAISIIPR
ncbi:hypothetical protein PY254_16320 [Rhodanobacter sp. AS-Z3]|uniref:hypothetical protein n=1 Tax=Rhodanobacter sp. AS-Z3 TaxID=3031330 RepID=UPI002478855A|nr:hypothetical protein [Rhodanobacter sp. AS-Z3]WEN14778.1 hypothetical protein PY254_16320 [Rhodanobacter sp. AS-Z3]